MSSETYYACKERDSVTLYYFPEDVKESRLAEEVANNTGCSLGCAILLFIALILFAPGLFIK